MKKVSAGVLSFILICILLVGYQNCSDTRLAPLGPETYSLSSAGSIKTQRPIEEARYTKFLFVVDKSGSNNTTDPQNRRATAIETFFMPRKNDPYIKWGFIQFGQTGNLVSSYIETSDGRPGFVDGNSGLVEAAIARHRATGDGGCTPYRGAFSAIQSAIRADFELNPNEASNSRYMIFFMSDGGPTDYSTSGGGGCPASAPGQPAYTDVTNTVNLTPPGPGRIFVSTAYYGPQDQLANITGLQNMATVYGGGRFVNIQSGQPINLDDLISGGVVQDPYIIKNLVIYNLNANLCEDGKMDVDSDGDGICDRDETKPGIGLDPTKRFTNPASAYGDFYHFRRIKFGDSLTPCNDPQGKDDLDFDLLSNCEERHSRNSSPDPDTLPVFPSVRDPDTDQDGFLDGIEVMMFRLLTSPTNQRDVLIDYDNEGQAGKQIRQHRDPRQFDPFNYTYDVRIQPVVTDPITGRTEYSIQMNDLQLFDTLATGVDGNWSGWNHSAGENLIYVHFIQIRASDPDDRGTLMRSLQKLRRGGPGLRLNDEAFQAYDIPNPTP